MMIYVKVIQNNENIYVSKSKIKHLGAKAVDEKYEYQIELSEIGTGFGQNFTIIKNTIVTLMLS